MELRQLESFVAIAEEGTFTRAAARVHVSQPGLSAQIRHLERELGAELFDRSAHPVALTTVGKAALPHARAALAGAAAMGQAVDEVTDLVRGQLTVGMVTGCTVTPLFDALDQFHQAHPGVRIALLEDSSDRLIQRIRSGTMDLALVGTAAPPPTDLESLLIISEPLVAVVPVGHRLANRSQINLQDLEQYPIVCMPPGTGLRTVFDQACSTLGIQPAITMQATAADSIATLAARGLAVGVLSASMAAGHQDRLAALPIADTTAAALLAFLWRATPSPAARVFLTNARRTFGC